MSTIATAIETGHQDHDHDHPEYLQHHFVSADQQFDSAKMGIWLFLVTEVLLFSGIFVAYAVFRNWYPDSFHETFSTLNIVYGFVNTCVLLTSSYTMVLAINSIQNNQVDKMVNYLFTTVALGAVFMLIKTIEYKEKYDGGIFFWLWEPHGHHYEHLANVAYASIFMKLYFVATGIHGLHVLIGMFLLLWVAWKGKEGRWSADYYNYVEVSGLYWHLVDIVWIFLFPLLYLTS
ncbi:MAG: cytochrome c oxidase subunit 3 family protein [Rhodothermia bacterium]|nr:cytochrome c oxidase subunit 3 family protein [Rhodothermia bacterium]